MLWVYFSIGGLVADVLGAFLLVRLFLGINPIIRPALRLFIWQMLQAANDEHGTGPNDKRLDRTVEELAKDYKHVKETWKAQLEGEKEFPIDERKFLLRQINDAAGGFILLSLGFCLQLAGILIQSLASM